jgi:hypothetical protein
VQRDLVGDGRVVLAQLFYVSSSLFGLVFGVEACNGTDGAPVAGDVVLRNEVLEELIRIQLKTSNMGLAAIDTRFAVASVLANSSVVWQ